MLNVLEIFHSIDGEGLRAGELATFIRLAGCNLHCKYCDTAYSIKATGTPMDIHQVLEQVKFKNVTITGGEPLIQSEVWDLCKALTGLGHSVNIETNGTIHVPPPDKRPGVIVTMDYKCLCSGHRDRMELAVFSDLGPGDVIKCVVDSMEDMEDALSFIRALPEPRPWVYMSPCWGFPTSRIVDFMKEHELTDRVRVQLQLHKYIWDPNKRMV